MKNRPTLYFFLLLLFVFLLYGYLEIFFKYPGYHHLWRQSDGLSITMNYYMENLNFFTPAVHYVGTKDGKTVSEFPIIYFTVAQFWKVFGRYEFIFRMLNILIVFSGLWCLFRFSREFLADTFWALFVPFFLFSSPILAYYTNNFIPDTPALGLSIAGGYFLWRAFKTEKHKWFYWAMLLFLLGGLIKISSILLFVALFIVHLYFIFFRRGEKFWMNNVVRLLPWLAVMILVAAWYRYAAWYDRQHLSEVFLQGWQPLWDTDIPEMKKLWANYTENMIPAIFSHAGYYLVLFLFTASLIFSRYADKVLRSVMILLFFGCISFTLMLYRMVTTHDYASINMLIFIPVVVLVFLDILRTKFPSAFKSRALKVIASAGLLLMLYTGAITNRMKYTAHDDLVKTNFIVNRCELAALDTSNQWFDSRFMALRTITPYLRHLGISRYDKVFSTPDRSVDNTLYMMDQKGVSDYFRADLPYGKVKMEMVKALGCKYIILNNTYFCRDTGLAPYLTHLIGIYRNVNIYKLD